MSEIRKLNAPIPISSFAGIRPTRPGEVNLQWYAAYTRSRHEKLVARHLEAKGVECFLPLYESMRRWKDRKKLVELALFPSYVFVRIDAQERLRVLEAPGMVRLVSFNGAPAPLPTADIETLRRGLDELVHAEPYPYLQVGRQVRVERGPLAGMQGVLLRKKDKFRLIISIDLIMRSISAEVDASDVRAA